MGFLTNTWTRYTDRTASQIKDNVLTNMQSDVPEITDHSDSNLFVKIVSIFAGIAELLNYYIDNVGREAHLDGARIYSNVVKLSRSWDYRIRSHQSASVLLTIDYTSINTISFAGVSIPAGAVVQTSTGIKFVTTETLNIPSGNFATARGQVSAQNIIPVAYTTLATSTGMPNQQYVINDKVAGFSLGVRVDGIAIYESVETFAYSTPTDQHFIQTVNESGQVIIKFGDGISGKIPPVSHTIEVEYNSTNGADGNVIGQMITQVVSGFPNVPNYTASVTNNAKAVAGSGVESVDSIKQNVSRLFRSNNRAVTALDFKDIAILHPQVENAGIIFTCGKTVDVYIVPLGGGIAPPSLLNSVIAWFNDGRRLITHRVKAFTAGEIHIQATINIITKTGFDTGVVQTNVEEAWLDYFDSSNQEISGSIRIGDIYERIESVEGVSVSDITLLNALPYPRVSGTTLNALDWTIQPTPQSLVKTSWRIIVTTATNFQLIKDNNFIGNFTIGVQVVQPEIIFTVNSSSYLVGDTWDFTSYPYGGNIIILDEPSIPVSDLTDLTLNVTT